ncbi:MAG TPA: cytochrome c biogenesis protein CcsA [Pyrinomonadaceae bacterium]|jgi:ABC-type transport system involved in cytochrome c biogenesis permease subunit
MSEVLKHPAQLGSSKLDPGGWSIGSYLPAALPVAGALVMLLLRIQLGGDHFINDGALMMLALAGYIVGGVFLLVNLYAPSGMAQKIGLWSGGIGVFCNLSSWLVRWVASHDRELAVLQRNGYGPDQMPWVWRYIPFANLYDLSLAFAFGAGVTTMLVSGRKSFRFIGAMSLPLASLVLILARFIGNEFINLPPVLDSYWRPIHVGTASISYGVALVCFAAAVLYLLKVGTKPESMTIAAAAFAIFVFATVGGQFGTFRILTTGNYAASTFLNGSPPALPLRVNIPYVGPALILAGLLLAGVIVLFIRYVTRGDEKSQRLGHHLLKASLVVQMIAIALLVSQIKSATPVAACPDSGGFFEKCYDKAQYPRFGKWLAEQQEGVTPEEVRALSAAQLTGASENFVSQRGSQLTLSTKANPVELSALITAFAATLFVAIFAFKTEKLRAALPAPEKLDSLMYKTASVAFAGLAILLITGAIWANESWGRYWGWDSKETGAFVAWLTYGGFLHARIARGLTGKRSAYFAIVAFLLVIFTYLGVSYLIPGLHSYA